MYLLVGATSLKILEKKLPKSSREKSVALFGNIYNNTRLL